MRAADPALLDAYLALERRLPRPRNEYERMLGELNDALERALEDMPTRDVDSARKAS
jgi:hypothetical protein